MQIRVFCGKMEMTRRILELRQGGNPMKKASFIAFIILLMILPTYAESNENEKEHKVVILHSYHKGLAWSDQLQAGVVSSLPDNVQIYTEYMDCYRFKGVDYYETLYNYYKEKYRFILIDVVILADNDAYDFYRQYGQDIFGNVPVVFVGINNFTKSSLYSDNMTGIAETSNQADNISLILKLHTEVDTIVVSGSNNATALEEAKAILKVGYEKFPNIKFENALSTNIESEIEILKKYDKNTAIIAVGTIMDKSGFFYDHTTFASKLIESTGLPVYAMAKVYVQDNGAVGGLVVDSYTHGQKAGEYAEKLLTGTKISELPIIEKPISKYVFNYKRLEQFSIDQSILPEGSTILGAPNRTVVIDKTFVYMYLVLITIFGCLVFIYSFNIIKRKRAEAVLKETKGRVEFLAYHDSVTELMKRSKLCELVDKQLAESDNKICVYDIDICNLKTINDTYGHDIGNQILMTISKTLKTAFEQENILIGIDMTEFIVVQQFNDDKEAVISKAQSIIDTFMQPIKIDNREVDLELCIGLAFYPEHGQDTLSLLKSADIATMQAIKNGKNTVCVYQEEFYKNILNKVKIEKELKKAISMNEFELYYQPKIDTKVCRVLGCEALIRWHRRDGQLAAPMEFVPIAEETGHIVPIGAWVIDQACKQIKMWQDEGLNLCVSVNVSPKQLMGWDLYNTIKEVIQKHGISPNLLELEITETAVMHDIAHNAELLKKIRALGVGIALDDFGTGYSSMNYIMKLPIDTLKIDKAFIDNIEERSQREIIKSMISLGHALSYRINIEGVERLEQFNILKTYQANEIQGYLFSKPIPSDEIRPFVLNFEKLYNHYYS